MYKEIEIGGKEYKLEYSIEASLRSECVESAYKTGMLIGDAFEGDKMIAEISNLPTNAVSLLYGGLLEHHGEDGDETVTSVKDARKLAKQYVKEHINDEGSVWVNLCLECLNQMTEDGFFKLIGLNMETEEQTEAEPPKKSRKKTTEATDK